MCAHDGIVEVSQKRIHPTYKLLNKQDDTCIAKYQHCVCVVLLSPAGDAAAADAVGRPAAADGRRRRTYGLMKVRQKPPATVATVAPAVAATLAAVAYTSNSGSSSASCLVESPLMSHTAAALRFGWPRRYFWRVFQGASCSCRLWQHLRQVGTSLPSCAACPRCASLASMVWRVCRFLHGDMLLLSYSPF